MLDEQLSGCTTVPNGWNPQLSGYTPSLGNLLDEDHTIEWVHLVMQWMRPIGWNRQLSGSAPSIGNILDEDQWIHWMGAPWFFQWMRPIGWKPKLSYRDSTTKLAIWKCNIPKNERQQKTVLGKYYFCTKTMSKAIRKGRQQNTTLNTLQKWEAKQKKKLCKLETMSI
jgi:hypothetical protein